jgi:hypothetical protein
MLINDNDCDISLPSPAEDRYIQPQGFFRTHANTAPFTGFLAMIQITRMYASLYQTLKSSMISPQNTAKLRRAIQIASAAAARGLPANLTCCPGNLRSTATLRPSYRPISSVPTQPLYRLSYDRASRGYSTVCGCSSGDGQVHIKGTSYSTNR